MSIAVAVRKAGELVLATDSQTTWGNSRIPADNHVTFKMRQIGASWVATTGWGLYENIFDDFLASRKTLPRLNNNASIFTFFLKLWKDLHAKYPFVKDQVDDEDHSPFGDLDASFLVVNKQGIFYVASDLSVTGFGKFYAIGSGHPYSMGALEALYDTDLDAEELARRSVEIACAYDLQCGGAAQIQRIK
ncbi:MAG: hypothetical protein NTX50_00240 [Candidatus Sumerlaeota bacterium]|nr:hypothetical protein [Candidatus Sumerlaeota bacterium]